MHMHPRLRALAPKRTTQRGATLIELMVGITIGLLTVTVALGSLMVSRGISGTVSEVSQLQQQASYAFRVIGQQLRQGGGRQLDKGTSVESETPLLKKAPGIDITPISGTDAPGSGEYALVISYQNVDELINAADPTKTPVTDNQMKNCLQENPGAAAHPMLTSQLKRNAADNTLVCLGTDKPQALIENVTDFSVKYLEETAGIQQYLDASAVTHWDNIYAVQVCIELEGIENIDSVGATYIKCDGTSASRGNRLRMVFNNIYNIRNHAWDK